MVGSLYHIRSQNRIRRHSFILYTPAPVPMAIHDTFASHKLMQWNPARHWPCYLAKQTVPPLERQGRARCKANYPPSMGKLMADDRVQAEMH